MTFTPVVNNTRSVSITISGDGDHSHDDVKGEPQNISMNSLSIEAIQNVSRGAGSVLDTISRHLNTFIF